MMNCENDRPLTLLDEEKNENFQVGCRMSVRLMDGVKTRGDDALKKIFFK